MIKMNNNVAKKYKEHYLKMSDNDAIFDLIVNENMNEDCWEIFDLEEIMNNINWGEASKRYGRDMNRIVYDNIVLVGKILTQMELLSWRKVK